jgi:preprotein translocase subunit YajC
MTLVMNTSFSAKVSDLVLSSVSSLFGPVALADGPAVPAGSTAPATGLGAAPSQPSGFMSFAPFILMFGVLYFLILRPQQKKMKEQQEMLTSLKYGDEILTNSGILGKVTGITDKVLTVEVADNVRVKMMKNQVSQVVKGSIKDLA